MLWRNECGWPKLIEQWSAHFPNRSVAPKKIPMAGALRDSQLLSRWEPRNEHWVTMSHTRHLQCQLCWTSKHKWLFTFSSLPWVEWTLWLASTLTSTMNSNPDLARHGLVEFKLNLKFHGSNEHVAHWAWLVHALHACDNMFAAKYPIWGTTMLPITPRRFLSESDWRGDSQSSNWGELERPIHLLALCSVISAGVSIRWPWPKYAETISLS